MKRQKTGRAGLPARSGTGEYPYLPALEDMVPEVDRYPEISLGLFEIPLELFAGTRTSGRKTALRPTSCL